MLQEFLCLNRPQLQVFLWTAPWLACVSSGSGHLRFPHSPWESSRRRAHVWLSVCSAEVLAATVGESK